MASNLLKLPCQTIKPSNFPNPSFLQRSTLFLSFPISQHDQQQLQHISKPFQKSKIFCSASSLSSYTPPISKEAAILQAKTCLSTTLEKPLNNLRLAGKLKKQKQPRFRVEIPVMDDSTDSLIQLALDFFQNIPITRKGTQLNILLLWPNSTLTDSANKAFSNSISSHSIVNMNLSSILTNNPTINSADLAIFLAPETSQLKIMKTVSDSLSPKPMVLFNPKWGFEEESEFGELSSFVGSFEVVYSFMGLEVRGIISKRKGVVFKCVRDGVLSGEKWEIFVEEEEEGKLKVISRFKKRPSICEVENVLYNVMAVNSPITKSAKFLRDLVSNVTGKKQNCLITLKPIPLVKLTGIYCFFPIIKTCILKHKHIRSH